MATGRQAQRALWSVAEHGVLDTEQVASLLRVSRPTAHRLLDGLVRAELLERRRAHWGRDHRWLCQLSWSGGRVVTEARQHAGQPALHGLFKRAGVGDRQHLINGFLVDLIRHDAGTDGRAGLVSWQHRTDARRWSAEHGVAHPECDGSGI
jgi:predicted ArsR family transcriptional regulator